MAKDTDLWSARDALVLKAMALVLGPHLNPPQGHGGVSLCSRRLAA